MFQSTRPRGARLGIGDDLAHVQKVSIHAPAWGATPNMCRPMQVVACFNPRARVGRDWYNYYIVTVLGGFNPRARVGRDSDSGNGSNATHCFNPRARVGRDRQPRRDRVLAERVSIHAPAWGATSLDPRHSMPAHVSIHAPAWGATSCRRSSSSSRGFNPRARVGRDAIPFSRRPAKLVFQSTRPRGARRLPSRIALRTIESFQSTRPRGARPRRRLGNCSASTVSIHAPAWGATQLRTAHRASSASFNPRARVGRDLSSHP